MTKKIQIKTRRKIVGVVRESYLRFFLDVNININILWTWPLLLFENKIMHIALTNILAHWKKNVLEMTLAAIASFASKVARQLTLERYTYSLEVYCVLCTVCSLLLLKLVEIMKIVLDSVYFNEWYALYLLRTVYSPFNARCHCYRVIWSTILSLGSI